VFVHQEGYSGVVGGEHGSAAQVSSLMQRLQFTGENCISNSAAFSRKVITKMESPHSLWIDLFTLLIKCGTIDNADCFEEDVITFLDSQHMPNLYTGKCPKSGMAQQQQGCTSVKASICEYRFSEFEEWRREPILELRYCRILPILDMASTLYAANERDYIP
jgi:hypothetical protein